MIPAAIKPYLIGGAILLLLAALAGGATWMYRAGAKAERVEWQGKQIDELAAANQEIQRLNAAARAGEQDHAVQLAGISTYYQKELQNAEGNRHRDVAAARSGSLVLRIPSIGLRASGSAAGALGAAAGGCDGRTTGELPGAPGEYLPGEISAQLIELAYDADDVARQLAAAQAVIVEDRRLCGSARAESKIQQALRTSR